MSILNRHLSFPSLSHQNLSKAPRFCGLSQWLRITQGPQSGQGFSLVCTSSRQMSIRHDRSSEVCSQSPHSLRGVVCKTISQHYWAEEEDTGLGWGAGPGGVPVYAVVSPRLCHGQLWVCAMTSPGLSGSKPRLFLPTLW